MLHIWMPKKYSKAFLITKVDSLEKLMIASDWLVSAESHQGQILFDFAITCDIMRYYENFFINTQKSDIFMLVLFKKKENNFAKDWKTLKTGPVFKFWYGFGQNAHDPSQ